MGPFTCFVATMATDAMVTEGQPWYRTSYLQSH